MTVRKEQCGRHELKHYINLSDFIQLRKRLSQVMPVDSFADSHGGYRVRSLYFDNYSDKALREKIDGVDQREKFRIRFYNGDTSHIRLEKKCKSGMMCYKYGATLPRPVCEALLEGNYAALRDTGQPLAEELYAKLFYQQLRPKTVVDYRRDAYLYAPGNVRVTLDYDIRSESRVERFLDGEFQMGVPLQGLIILEVKYDQFLPELIRGITTLSSRQQTAFSKYAATRII